MIHSPGDLAGCLVREYLRVSDDKGGGLGSPAEQHNENAEHAIRNGWKLGEPYAEREAISASRYSDKGRDEFGRLLADLAAGQFLARILILWESSRGSRMVGEWVDLIEACEVAGVLIYVTTHSRLYDPADPRDRRTLLEDAVDSEYESAKTRKRVLRSTAARAARGEPHGRVPYGYQRAYDPITRRLIRQEKHLGEAPNVEELFARLHAGDTFKAITADWATRRILTRGSKACPPRPFRHTDLLKMARNPAYAGLRVRTPKGAKRAPGDLDGAVEAKWPALVDAEAFHAVQAALADPSRRTSRDGRARHLLGMIARCGACGGPLTARYRGAVRYYFCRDGGHVCIDADDLDAVAGQRVREYLAREDVATMLAPSPGSLPELGAVRAELDAARAELGSWREKAGRRLVTAESFALIEPPLLADIARLQERERALSAPPELDGWLGTVEEVAARWEAATVAARRTVIRRLLSPPYLGWLAVVRSPDGQAGIPAEWRARLVRAPLPAAGAPAQAAPADRDAAREVRRAARAGVTASEYRDQLARGLLFCLLCGEFHPRGEFGSDKAQPGGLAGSCRRSLRERRAEREAAHTHA